MAGAERRAEAQGRAAQEYKGAGFNASVTSAKNAEKTSQSASLQVALKQ